MFLQVVTVSGNVEVSENNLAGKAELDALSLTLKWSEVGSLNITSIQVCYVVIVRHEKSKIYLHLHVESANHVSTTPRAKPSLAALMMPNYSCE